MRKNGHYGGFSDKKFLSGKTLQCNHDNPTQTSFSAIFHGTYLSSENLEIFTHVTCTYYFYNVPVFYGD